MKLNLSPRMITMKKAKMKKSRKMIQTSIPKTLKSLKMMTTTTTLKRFSIKHLILSKKTLQNVLVIPNQMTMKSPLTSLMMTKMAQRSNQFPSNPKKIISVTFVQQLLRQSKPWSNTFQANIKAPTNVIFVRNLTVEITI